MPAEHSTPEGGRAGLRGLSSQLFVASLRTACQAQAASRVLARLVVVPGGAGWATGWARAVGGKGRLIFLYSGREEEG